jgi:hypothetical protein
MADRFSPTGKRIVGTSETLLGTARISSFNDDGTFEYSGVTEDYPESSETKTNDKGEIIFVDEAGDEWPASKLRKTACKPRKKS